MGTEKTPRVLRNIDGNNDRNSIAIKNDLGQPSLLEKFNQRYLRYTKFTQRYVFIYNLSSFIQGLLSGPIGMELHLFRTITMTPL